MRTYYFLRAMKTELAIFESSTKGVIVRGGVSNRPSVSSQICNINKHRRIDLTFTGSDQHRRLRDFLI